MASVSNLIQAHFKYFNKKQFQHKIFSFIYSVYFELSYSWVHINW